jgi:uncharacterized membrane protein YedE/YeeE
VTRGAAVPAAFGSGLIFGVGLVVSGMAQPTRVIGFLDVFGAWDPSLLFVMAGAVAVHFTALRLIARRNAPLYASEFDCPRRAGVDGRLVAGAALFGVGWGLSGYCPGPSVVSLPSASASVLVFVGAMAIGMWLVGRFGGPRASAAESMTMAHKTAGR